MSLFIAKRVLGSHCRAAYSPAPQGTKATCAKAKLCTIQGLKMRESSIKACGTGVAELQHTSLYRTQHAALQQGITLNAAQCAQMQHVLYSASNAKALHGAGDEVNHSVIVNLGSWPAFPASNSSRAPASSLLSYSRSQPFMSTHTVGMCKR